jgi:peptidoglycan hydrolase CwlO-like protein
MECYLSLSPANTEKEDFQDWVAVLKELDRVRKDKKGMEEKKQDLQAQIEKLRTTLGKIQEANKNLGDEVANLQKMIERLMILDYQMEEKRHPIK